MTTNARLMPLRFSRRIDELCAREVGPSRRWSGQEECEEGEGPGPQAGEGRNLPAKSLSADAVRAVKGGVTVDRGVAADFC